MNDQYVMTKLTGAQVSRLIERLQARIEQTEECPARKEVLDLLATQLQDLERASRSGDRVFLSMYELNSLFAVLESFGYPVRVLLAPVPTSPRSSPPAYTPVPPMSLQARLSDWAAHQLLTIVSKLW